MNEVLRNIGLAIEKFFAETVGGAAPLDVVDHGDPDSGRTYLHSISATTSTFNLAQRTVDNYDILTKIAPPEFWLEIEERAIHD